MRDEEAKAQELPAEEEEPHASGIGQDEEDPIRSSFVRQEPSKRRGSMLRRDSERTDHLQDLLKHKEAQVSYVSAVLERKGQRDVDEAKKPASLDDEVVRRSAGELSPDSIGALQEQSAVLQKALKLLTETRKHFGAQVDYPMEVHVKSLTFTVPDDKDVSRNDSIPTVYNTSLPYKLIQYFTKKWKGQADGDVHNSPQQKAVLDDISLCLRPGTMHLVLGAPGSGKTSLLRAIAGRLPLKPTSKQNNKKKKKEPSLRGTVSYNGKEMSSGDGSHIENLVAFIEQHDRHAARLTVDETFEFAFQCKTAGGAIAERGRLQTDEAREFVKKLSADRVQVGLILEGLGLDHVRDTYVGDQNVRGVSGGQRRRVTCGEMAVQRNPVLCGDEISTGLDAKSTYEICKIIMFMGRAQQLLRVISLLQPSPETVSLFDEVILLAEGKLLYSGPIADVEDYFAALGYRAPDQMDVADFLQHLTISADAVKLFDSATRATPYSSAELAELFRNSELGKRIQYHLQNPPEENAWQRSNVLTDFSGSEAYKLQHKYANGFFQSTWLNLKRMLTLWIRDRRVLITNAIKIIIMGASVGGVFFQTDNFVSILGVLFQGVLFIMLGAMNTSPGLIDERVIFYKHQEANFFSAYPYVVARAISQMPQILADITVYGSFLYWMVGLAKTAKNFFVFLAILFVFDVLLSQMFSIYAAVSKTKATVFVMCACSLLLLILFGGYILAPNAVPDYYLWIYWWNPLAWAYRALVVNEFRSSKYTEEEGETILEVTGFLDANNEPFSQEWVTYGFVYMVPYTVLCVLLSAIGLTYVHVAGDSPSPAAPNEDEDGEIKESEDDVVDEIQIQFQPVTLTFENICYDVQASTTNETLRLLNGVNGVFRPGRMCALMGSSGAGKTTLLDVIALRKKTGTVHGEVRLNGFSQEPAPFRRCSGYVEQFDVQTPQLTVKETVLFSARLRLDPELVQTDHDKQLFVEQVLQTLELQNLADSLVGDDETGGLTFEQKKRLSIAVELAASPSIIFLDEPTSGLDARSALVVVKTLRKIASQGRTICATIHQPSFTVFNMFDDLLLLKKGGRVVFFGELGSECQNLIEYFHAQNCVPIQLGENPANWMLKAVSEDEKKGDLAEAYLSSPGFSELQHSLQSEGQEADPGKKISFSNEFAVSYKTRSYFVSRRLSTIYWRSPAYNYSRLMVALLIAFIMSSVFIPDRDDEILTESYMNSILSVIFLSFIIIGILSITSVLPLMLSIRDMFYRHKAAGMVDYKSLAWALGVAEKWFIVLSSFVFCIIFIPVSGLEGGWKGAIGFWGFFTFNSALYSYFGQAFMCLVGPMAAAQILGTIFIGLNNFFSGLIVRPQYLSSFFEIPYWITPGHYVYEGMVVSQFQDDDRLVRAIEGSDFYEFLMCDSDDCIGVVCSEGECAGTAWQFVDSFFGGRFSGDNILRNALILSLFLVTARGLTFFGLRFFNFSS